MGFMEPETTYARRWLRVERKGGNVRNRRDGLRARTGDVVERLGPGYCARLSAPGYLDCTEWHGPYESERAALAELAEMHDICAHCFADECQSDDVATQCYPAALDSLRANVRNATAEALRGRIRETHNEWIGRAIVADVARLRELRESGAGSFPDCGAAECGCAERLRADVRRECALGIEEARRAILAELRELLRGAVAPDPDGSALVGGARFSRFNLRESVALRFPSILKGS